MKEMTEGFLGYLKQILEGKRVLLLGFGREGRSSLQTLLLILPGFDIGIADKDPRLADEVLPAGVTVHSGPDYLVRAGEYDYCLCSPGIPYHQIALLPQGMTISSQTDLFLRYYHTRCIGITGTKGKSTTSTLVRDMLEYSGVPAELAGNIGVPPFEAAAKRGEENIWFVLELSAHQLSVIQRAPHIACILNLFEEHLDHFPDLEAYFGAKWNIGLRQDSEDHLIVEGEDQAIAAMISRHPVLSKLEFFTGPEMRGSSNADFTSISLEGDGCLLNLSPERKPAFRGVHQRRNAIAAAMMARHAGATPEGIDRALTSFRGLPHRLEYLGEVNGIHYYNDAIATIPEAVIEAIRTLGRVDTLILGGQDRGISYDALVSFLMDKRLEFILLSGPAGTRIRRLLENGGYQGRMKCCATFGEAVDAAMLESPLGSTVLLSPAASSYDEFRNFTEKGDLLRKKIGNLH